MKDDKSWYEKVYIWIGIVAGICTILGISIYGGLSLLSNDNEKINAKNINTDNQSPVQGGINNNVTYNNYYTNETIDTTAFTENETSAQFNFEQPSQNNYNDKKNNNNQDAYFDDENSNLFEEELFIKRNFDLIQRLKAKYLYEDTEIIENDSVEFYIYESAGYIYQDLIKTDESDKLLLMGDGVPFTKVIILDYYSDEVIYTFTPENSNKISYYPGEQNVFYCVVFHDNYDIYVSSPIQVVGGKYQNIIDICLERKHSEYTPLFQIRLYVQDIESDSSYSIVPDGYGVQYHCENKYTNNSTVTAQTWTSGTEIFSVEQYSYFSLNTNYSIDFSLSAPSDDVSHFIKQTFDGTITNSNLIDINFDWDRETLP